MKNFLLVIFLFVGSNVFSQQNYVPSKENLAARQQFQDILWYIYNCSVGMMKVRIAVWIKG